MSRTPKDDTPEVESPRRHARQLVDGPEEGRATGTTPPEAEPILGDLAGPVPKRFCGKPGRSGPPKGNTNALRHGMRGGKLPKGCQYIENRVNALRRQVESALIEAKGEINIVDAAAVNSILKWERHGLLAAHWLRHEAEKLSASDRLRFSEAIAKASDSRDKAIRSLGLDRDKADNVLDVLYSRLPAPDGKDQQ
jgi:hypothetical protein